MPKTQTRHQRRYNRLCAENDFNRVMKEYVTLKYGPIAEEFCVFYDQLREKYPERNVYKNTKEFRRWVKDEITKYIEEHSNDYAGQIEQSEANSNETNNNNDYAGQIEQSEANSNETNNNNNNDYAGQIEQSEANSNETNNNNNDYAGQIEQSEANSNETNNNNDYAGQIEQSEANNNNAAAGQIELADREIGDIINELENGGVPLLSDDEGIKLDLYEELQGVTEDFNYELEVDDSVFW